MAAERDRQRANLERLSDKVAERELGAPRSTDVDISDVVARTAEAERKAEEARLDRCVPAIQGEWDATNFGTLDRLVLQRRRMRVVTPPPHTHTHTHALNSHTTNHACPACCLCLPRSERKLRAVKLNKEDVALMEKEFDVKTDVAERLLREQGGDLQTTIRHLIGLKP
jgi:hypothetical protein